jgi:hypothetical protein
MYGGGANIGKGETVAESCGRQQRESRGCVLPAELPHHTISNSHVGHPARQRAKSERHKLPASVALTETAVVDCATEDSSNSLRTLCSGRCQGLMGPSHKIYMVVLFRFQ